ncbi:cytochrome c/c1 heme-lyase [Kockiozyma suomiensis]|uniref:cytochrome c/c1 heme-lyase n=1 Tax=Kockiozyma suomiensis TaxID=1337062 RepID=UPI0033431F64
MVWIPFWSKKSSEDATTAAPAEPAKCPVDHTKMKSNSGGACPVDHSKLDPRTNMPANLSATQRVPGQKIALPTERTISSIPQGEEESSGLWEYPSPQQMLNAMVRKGHKDTPETDVPAMVDVHNFLNEGAWSEILKWEEKYYAETGKQPRLLKFTGRPDTPSPRARMLELMGGPPPFDRHDWTVLRYNKNGDKQKVRYVIDYYSGEPEPDGYPSFYLDVRPALDSVGSAYDRFSLWSSEVWDKAIGRGGRVG